MSPTHSPAPSPAPVGLLCPKCAVGLVTYERSSIHVDQCPECRGIFLDRGELERLVDAESGGAGWTGPRMNLPAPGALHRASHPLQKTRGIDEYAYRPEWFWEDETLDRR